MTNTSPREVVCSKDARQLQKFARAGIIAYQLTAMRVQRQAVRFWTICGILSIVAEMEERPMVSLREQRLKKMLSQRDLARAARVAPKTIIDLELGRVEPHLKTMRKIATALGVDPLEIDEFQKAIAAKVAA